LTHFRYTKALIGFGIVIFILFADQISKWLILEHVFLSRISPDTDPMGFWAWLISAQERMSLTRIELLPFFNLTMVWNEGISFGLFKTDMPVILIALSLIITVLFSIWLVRSRVWFQVIPLSLIIGGALGNVIDRAKFGAVADFLDFHIAGWHYPAFNIADSCITLGIALLVIDGLFLEPKRDKEK